MIGSCLFVASVVCFIIGFIQLASPDRGTERYRARPRPARAPQPVPTRALAETPSGGTPVVAEPQTFNWVQLGQRITVRHPGRGEMMGHVMGRVVFTELWQRQRGPQNPWVPTGNSFLGFWLEGDLLLLNWQNRVYVLDEAVQLSDAEIARTFAPHAKKFAQSGQTADVYFAYPPASWRIDDIGKFQVAEVSGEGLRLQPGATGRFIHASGDAGRALVVEDYEGAGGQDTAWVGYQITAEDVQAYGS